MPISNRRDFLRTLGVSAAALGGARWLGAEKPAAKKKPNFIIFFTDDQGYQDVGCFGSPLIRTPRFDRMAAEGMRFTSFYAQAVCGPSRAAIMTGCYPIRVGEPGNTKGQHSILHPKEITIAEVLKTRGYATALIGKWHLAGGGKGGRGRGPYTKELMPNSQGFDYFFGTPMHNGYTREVNDKYITELMRNDQVLDSPTDMNLLTQRYTAEAVGFIRKNRDRPFFVYLAHNMPHVPLGASEKFRGKSKRGLYGDVIQELDWSAGQVIDTLKELGLDENTLMVFTSDNGPWIEKHLGDYGGCAKPLRGAKMMTWDGGPRVPGIMRWPGRIPAGKVCDHVVTTMDLLPTLAKLAGATVPQDRIIDGRDVLPVITAQEGAAPREAYYFYCYTHLQAVRSGKWKLVLPRPARPRWCGWSARMVDAVDEVQLFDLDADIGEKRNVAAKNADVVKRLMKLVDKAREDLGDYDRVGKGARFFDDGPKRPDMKALGRKPARKNKKQPRIVHDHPEPVGKLRFDFENGDLQGWKVVEGKFEAAINDRPRFHNIDAKYNKQGKYYMTTLERAAGGRGNDLQTGVVESPVFRLEGGKMSFLVGGGSDPTTYVALCEAASGKELRKASGNQSEVMQRINWDVTKYKGRNLFLRVVDRKGAHGWGHVTFDDFSTDGTIDAKATAQRWKK